MKITRTTLTNMYDPHCYDDDDDDDDDDDNEKCLEKEQTDDNDNNDDHDRYISMTLSTSPYRTSGLFSTNTKLWDCESMTPMTSRPHIVHVASSSSPTTTTTTTSRFSSSPIHPHHHPHHHLHENHDNDDDNQTNHDHNGVLRHALRWSQHSTADSTTADDGEQQQQQQHRRHHGEVVDTSYLLVPSLFLPPPTNTSSSSSRWLHPLPQAEQPMPPTSYDATTLDDYNDDDRPPHATNDDNDHHPHDYDGWHRSSSHISERDIMAVESHGHDDDKEEEEMNKDHHRTIPSHDSYYSHDIIMCILYGMINATIITPVLISFGSIIYRDDIFQNYMNHLIQLTLVSGIVHQIAFTTFSSLPFAVGQVQDAGLIFLSQMAHTIVQYCTSNPSATCYYNINDHDDDDMIPLSMLATVTILLGCGTAFLGISLVVIGKLQLAQYVQLLPTSVVGGYLAYIGLFCGISGIDLMAGTSDLTISNIYDHYWIYIVPGIVGGIVIYTAIRTIRHMAVLPTCIIALLLLFHLVLYITDTSVDDAIQLGWIRSMNPPSSTTNSTTDSDGMSSSSSSSDNDESSWYHTWDYLQLRLVDWTVVPQLIMTELSMIVVVALSSSLDVAAIELELEEQARRIIHNSQPPPPQQQQQHHHHDHNENPTSTGMTNHPNHHTNLLLSQLLPAKLPLDYNRELKTVGYSNIISGLTGGYTGSYIFSQSIFTLRAGIKSRITGYVLALCQLALWISPIPILSYVPNYLFGSLLIMICIDLLYEWLYHVRYKISLVDYMICWITFLSIPLLWNSVEYGILTGCFVHVVFHNELFPIFPNNKQQQPPPSSEKIPVSPTHHHHDHRWQHDYDDDVDDNDKVSMMRGNEVNSSLSWTCQPGVDDHHHHHDDHRNMTMVDDVHGENVPLLHKRNDYGNHDDDIHANHIDTKKPNQQESYRIISRDGYGSLCVY